jgi:hypothetical protein
LLPSNWYACVGNVFDVHESLLAGNATSFFITLAVLMHAAVLAVSAGHTPELGVELLLAD